jgi:hypothetical protein
MKEEGSTMTHTYVRMGEDRYDVGQWLPDPEGHVKFYALFSVPNLKQAFAAVCMLNGGTRISPDALHILEEKS